MIIQDGITAGIHSTSIEAVKILQQTRNLLGRDIRRPVNPGTRGYLYFTPIKKRFIETQFYKELSDEHPGYNATEYAHHNAFKHYLWQQLGFIPTACTATLLDKDIYMNYAEEHAKLMKETAQKKIPASKVEQILTQARQRKGVNICLSDKIKELELELDWESEDSMRIKTPALPIGYILRVEFVDSTSPDAKELNEYLSKNRL